MARPSSILRSRHREEINECLKSGWSPDFINLWLKLQCRDEAAEIPSVRAMYRYRKRYIPVDQVVPASVIKEKLKGIEYKVDLLPILARAIWALEQRFGANWEREQDTANGVASPNTDRAAATLLEYLREYRRVAQDLGIMPAQDDRLQVEMQHTQRLEVREEDLPDLIEALKLAKGQLPPGQWE